MTGNSAKILAANTVTIVPDVTVTIDSSTPADVYTTNANYSGFGGTSPLNGTFGGAGANEPQALSAAPAFDESGGAATTEATTSGSTAPSTANGPPGATGVVVSDSGQLLSLLDGAAVGPDGKIIIPNSHGRNNPRNSNPRSPAGRFDGGREPMDVPRKSSSRAKAFLP